MPTSGTVMNLIPAGLNAQTAKANASKRRKEHTPEPGGGSQLTLHSSDTDVTALGTADLSWIV